MKNFYNINFDLTKNEIVKLDWDPYNHQLLIIMDQISKQILKTVQTEILSVLKVWIIKNFLIKNLEFWLI